MSKKKTVGRWGLPAGVVETVRGICRDYERKRSELNRGILDAEVRALYESYNAAVNDALLEIEESIRLTILEDIASDRGFERSKASLFITSNAYKARKKRLIYKIACNLHFIQKDVQSGP